MGTEHWIVTSLGDIATHPQYGWTTKATNKGNYKYFRTTDIDDPIQWDKVPYCTDLPHNLQDYTIQKNDILVSRAGSVGLSIRINENHPDTLFASYLIRFKPIDPIDSKLLKYYFQTKEYWAFIYDFQAGIAVPNVNATKLSSLPFPLPPIGEQKRIVEKLDTILPIVKSIKARLDKIPKLLKKFRQSILSAACSGKLTEVWRVNNPKLENASLFFSKINLKRIDCYNKRIISSKQSKLSKPKRPVNLSEKLFLENIENFEEIPSSWFFLPLAKITGNENDCLVDGPFGTSINVKNDYMETGIPVIRINNIRPFKFVPVNLKYITHKKFIELKRHNIINNDILLVKVGATIGDCCIYSFNLEGLLSTTGSCRIRIDNEVTISRFVCIVLNNFKNYLQNLSSEMAQPFLNMDKIKNLPFPLPPLKEQQEIVCRVEKLFKLADSLEAKYKLAMERVDKIEQSVLAKAFRGELVDPDPNDEPAEQLLARILEEKAILESNGKGRKKKKLVNR